MKKPGILQFQPFAAAEFQHSDSLEAIIDRSLNLTATYDSDYGTPRRGNFVWEQSDGTMAPIGAAEIVEVDGAGEYTVTFYADVKTNDEVTVFSGDGLEKATGKVTSVTKEVTDIRGLKSGANTIKVTFDEGQTEPSEPALIVFTAADGEAPAGIVYESVLDDEFACVVEINGARLEKVFGGRTDWVKGLSGVTVAHGVLFFTIK